MFTLIHPKIAELNESILAQTVYGLSAPFAAASAACGRYPPIPGVAGPLQTLKTQHRYSGISKTHLAP